MIIEDAIIFAAEKHRGQRDKLGRPYILHPLRVAMRLTDEREQLVAILHDLVEDTGVTADELRARGVEQEVVDAVLALSKPGGVIVCNGYKDREYIRLALIGRKLGLETFIVIEKASELETVIDEAAALGVRPGLGVRMRLASLGAGKWQNSGGDKAKFGLSPRQLLDLVGKLGRAGMADCLQLLHFHMGSQISNVRDIASGMREATRYLVEVSRLKNVEIGLIPAAHDYRSAQLEAPLNSFDLFDDALLTLDIYKGWLHFWSPDMISEYKTYFERLRSSALFGDALARAIEKIVHAR